MRKLFYVTTIMVIALVSFLGVTYSYEYNDDNSLKFELIGPYELYLDVNTEYNEYGINVIRNGYNVSSLVKIDNSSVDINKLGEYKVKYEIDNNGYTEYIYRIVKVIDKVNPEIKLLGDEIVYVNLNGMYFEPGYIVSDNYDTDINRKVVVTNNVNTSLEGDYKVIYKVSDSSSNETIVERIVKVIDKDKNVENNDNEEVLY